MGRVLAVRVMFTMLMMGRKRSQRKRRSRASAIRPLELEVGFGLIPLVDREQNGELLDRIQSIRSSLRVRWVSLYRLSIFEITFSYRQELTA